MSQANKGVYAASITPVDSAGSPDNKKLLSHCRWLLDEGLDGVAPLGSTGEGNSLPLAYRLSLPAVFRDAGFQPGEVIFGTGSCAVGDAIAATKAALSAGFNNALVLPPFYYKNMSEQGLYDYFSRVIEGAADDSLRLYLYHFPALSMSPITVPLIQRLRDHYGPVIAGLKDSSGDFKGTLEFVSAVDNFDVFSSNEAMLVEGMAKGCAGVISATTNASPSLAAATLKADGAQADKHQKMLTAIRQSIASFPLSAAMKQIAAWQHDDQSWCEVLPPNINLSADQASELRKLLDGLGPDANVFGLQRHMFHDLF